MDPVAHGRVVRAQSVMLAERMAAMENLAGTLTRLAMARPARAAYLLAQRRPGNGRQGCGIATSRESGLASIPGKLTEPATVQLPPS
jgi:hypothetical protein